MTKGKATVVVQKGQKTIPGRTMWMVWSNDPDDLKWVYTKGADSEEAALSYAAQCGRHTHVIEIEIPEMTIGEKK